ncbi:hypothetical protein HDU76_000572 [Blyttiomyces sp. JEL0837]|nr:hypothetical protein HDU76_000572 [Blyttiomyces sp. JEL0837]
MNIKPLFLRNICSVLFSLMYLFYPDAAEEKTRRFRATANIEVMRLSWEKSLNPILRFITFPDRGFLRFRHDIKFPRPYPPSPSSFPIPPNAKTHREIKARIYFNGSKSDFQKATSIILLFPGGGFTGLPIVSIDYGKAPEFPYPWALEECFDAYRAIVETNGACVGLEGWYVTDAKGRMERRKDPISVVVMGDSAGGNLAASCVLKCLDSSNTKLSNPVPAPAGVILIYPCLNFDMAGWMPNKDRALLRAESSHTLAMQNIIDAHEKIKVNAPFAHAPAPRSIDIVHNTADRKESWYRVFSGRWSGKMEAGPTIPSALSMTSRMSYFTDRILAPEMLRAMGLMYLGSSPVEINFTQDYFLSPVVAPDELLARFPKTYLICGEKDPFIDDTVIFAGRLREAKKRAHLEFERLRSIREYEARRREAGISPSEEKDGIVFKSRAMGATASGATGDEDGSPTENASNGSNADIRRNDSTPSLATFLPPISDSKLDHHIFHRDPHDMVHVKILEGVSHAFLQMMALLPEAKPVARLIGEWALDCVEDEEWRVQVGIDRGDDGEGVTDFVLKGLKGGAGATGAAVNGGSTSQALGLTNTTAAATTANAPANQNATPLPRTLLAALGATAKHFIPGSVNGENVVGGDIQSPPGSRSASPKTRGGNRSLARGNTSSSLGGIVSEESLISRRRMNLASNHDIN